MSFNVGESVGPYRIIEQLGQGGMATVYKAYHASLDRYVALKVLHPAFNEDPNFEARFQREARLVANLEHPNIVPVYDYAEHENRPYLVMKYIEGETLKSYMARGPLTSDEIARIVDAVGAGLGYAHRKGVLHRDIKPSNVLIATDGQIYLADFGLARIAQSGESTMSSDMIMGTPQYISPEQAMGKKDLDEGTDLYSFGVMLYEMVVGQVPFSADTPFSVIHDHIYSPLPPPTKVNPNVPESVERVLLKSLAKERADRYENAASMVKAFKEAWIEAGVPMQGSMVKLSQSIKPPVEKTTAKPAKTEVAQKAAPVPVAVPVPQVEKKRSSSWLFVGIGIVLVMFCAVALFVLRTRPFASNRNNPQNTQVPVAPVATQVVPPLPGDTPVPSTPTQEKPQLSPQVLQAQKTANDHPNDMDAQLGLSLTYWDAGMQRQAYEALLHASQVAGPTNEPFYIHAGDEYKKRQGWVAASAMYLRAVKIHGLNGPVPQDLNDSFHEAVYKAGDRPEFLAFLPPNAIAEVDQPIALIAQSRHAFYSGKIDDALVFLKQVKLLKPDMAEAFLLEGEFDSIQNKPQEAKLILNGLVANLSNPDWIRNSAQDLLNKIP